MLRVASVDAMWLEFVQSYTSDTNGARLALLEKYDKCQKCHDISSGVRDDPIKKLIEMEELARQL